ncbi:hypothetical protein C0995_006995, partial [Termitomyces sp. Mi166
MAPKILLLNVFSNACLLEREHAAQKFIVAANTVFLKAQGLATLAPLHKMAFGLLEGLLDNWHLLNLTTIEWLHKAEAAEFGKTVVSWEHAISTIEQIKLMHFEKMAIELKSTAPSVAPWPIMNLVPTPVSITSSIQHAPSVSYIVNPSSPPMHLLSELSLQKQEEEHSSQWLAPQNKGKGKAKVTEDDDNDKKATQKLKKELEDFVVLTTNGIGVRTQKKHPPLATLVMAKHVKLVQVAKAFLEQQGKPSQFFVLEGYKGKGKAKALLEDSEQMGANNSNEEEEEDRVHVIKKIKHKHVEKLTGTKRRKEIIELDEEVEIVASKAPTAGPSCLTSKPVVVVPSTPKLVPKLIITLASPIAGPSTAPIASSSAPKSAAAAALSTSAPAKSADPAVKGGFIFKDPFMVRQFKLAGTEESGVLIINQVTEVPMTQGTMPSEDSSDEDVQSDNDDSNNSNVAMDVDSTRCPEAIQPVAPIKTVTEVKAPVPVLV